MRRLFAPALLCVVLIAGGCAHTTSLQVAQTSHDSLALAQDLEAQLCWGVPTAADGPANKSHCTAPIAATIALTDARHQAINAKLALAFRLHHGVQSPDLH